MRLALAIVFLATAQGSVCARQSPKDQAPTFYYASLTDPACPVSGYEPPAPVTKEIHVLYFPMGQNALIKAPKSPVAHFVFDGGFMPDSDLTLPLTRRDDGVWVGTIPLAGRFFRYAMYWIEDRDTRQIDNNDGKYFEIRFCDIEGHPDQFSVHYEAGAYAGQLHAHGVELTPDYAKAIDILEEYIHPPTRGGSLVGDLWRYKLKLGGDTPQARTALLAEITKFISDHSADGFGLHPTLNFAAYQDWFPADEMEKLVKAIDNEYPDDHPEAFLLAARASREKDRNKRIDMDWEIVNKYPTSQEADSARKRLLLEVGNLSQVEKLYQQLRIDDPDDAFLPWNMASRYAARHQKLPEALALLDLADKLLDDSVTNKQARIHYPETTLKDVKLRIAILRSDILLQLSRPAEALSVLQRLKGEFTSGSSYYLLGKALKETGDKRGAIDAYLESVVRPSKDQQHAETALKDLWASEKLGSDEDLQQRIQAKLAQTFTKSDYIPRILGHPAPEFDLTTLKGERLTSAQLRGKTVIIDFWAVWCGPCLWELKPLDEFQQKHPELIVVAAVVASPEAKQIDDVIQSRKLTNLRIAIAPSDLQSKFGAGGVPDTFILDENGFVRIEHLGAVPDLARYFGADLKAIAEAGPVENAPAVAAK
jgi:thiol-disulfide isomerase/thioredoxin